MGKVHGEVVLSRPQTKQDREDNESVVLPLLDVYVIIYICRNKDTQRWKQGNMLEDQFSSRVKKNESGSKFVTFVRRRRCGDGNETEPEETEERVQISSFLPSPSLKCKCT